MIKAIKTWWRHLTRKDFHVYVITIDGVASLVLYDKWEAAEYCLRLLDKGLDNVEMHETEIV